MKKKLCAVGLLAFCAGCAFAQVVIIGRSASQVSRRLAISHAFVNQIIASARASMTTNDAAQLPSTNDYQIIKAVLIYNATNWDAEFTYQAR